MNEEEEEEFCIANDINDRKAHKIDALAYLCTHKKWACSYRNVALYSGLVEVDFRSGLNVEFQKEERSKHKNSRIALE